MKIIHNPDKGNLYKAPNGYKKLLFKMYSTKAFLTRQLFQRIMISCFKTNFKIEMSLPSRKTQQLWRLFHFSFFHILLDLILRGKKDIKEKIACNTEQNLLQKKQLHILNHKKKTTHTQKQTTHTHKGNPKSLFS